MKTELTITQIAAKLEVSERTALRRIADGKLLAKKLGPNRYLVSTEDIDELAPRAKLSTLVEQVRGLQDTISGQGVQSRPEEREQITALAAELGYQGEIIEALKGELEALRDRVSALEQGQKGKARQRVIVESVDSSVPQTAEKPSRQRVQTPKQDTATSTRPTLPEGWSSWTPFIERHGIGSERRPLRAINREEYCEPGEYMQPNQKGVGSVLVKCALSADGMGRLLAAIKALPLGQGLTQCDVEACPCHQIVEAQGTLW